MAKKQKRFKVVKVDGSYDLLSRDYEDEEFDSVHKRWIFYHKNGRDNKYYEDDEVDFVKRI